MGQYAVYLGLALLVTCCGGRSSLEPSELDVDAGGFSGSSGGRASGGTAAAGVNAGGRMGTAGSRPIAGTSSGGLGGGGASAGKAGQSPIEGGAGGEAGAALGGAAGEAGAGGASPITPPAIDVAVGAFHSCALFEGGTVRCWGSAGYTGYGTGESPLVLHLPSEQGDVDVGGVVTRLTASWYETCAILEGGALRCWGSGYRGKLGHGNSESVGDDETPASAGDILTH